MKWRKISRLCNLAPLRGRLAIGNGEGQENFPRERWHHVRPLILFINSFTHLHLQLEWLISIPWSNSIIIILYPHPLFATKLSWCRSSLFQQNQEAVHWTSSVPPERTQCRQGSMRGGCSTIWNRCLIDSKPTSFQWCARPFDGSFAICAPPKARSTSTKGRFCTPLKDPEWQWGCSGKMTRSMSQEGWKGLSRHVSAISIN